MRALHSTGQELEQPCEGLVDKLVSATQTHVTETHHQGQEVVGAPAASTANMASVAKHGT
jgi:hypothetical protein